MAPTMRLDPDEWLPEAAFVSEVEARDDGVLLPSLAHGLWDPILEPRSDDGARSLTRLPASSHAEVLDLARLVRVYERAATTTTTRRLYLDRLTARSAAIGSRSTAQRDPTDAPPPLASHAEQSLCPVRALNDWLDVRAMRARGGDLSATHGPVFVALRRGGPHRFHLGDRLAPTDVDRIVKLRAVAAGLNPAGLSAVSLRARFSAEAARGGASSTT